MFTYSTQVGCSLSVQCTKGLNRMRVICQPFLLWLPWLQNVSTLYGYTSLYTCLFTHFYSALIVVVVMVTSVLAALYMDSDGKGKGTHVSFFLILCSHVGTSQPYQMPGKEMNVASGCPVFVLFLSPQAVIMHLSMLCPTSPHQGGVGIRVGI